MSTGNEVLAFCLSLGAGLTTAIGGLLPFFVKVENVKFLAASMGLAAGNLYPFILLVQRINIS